VRGAHMAHLRGHVYDRSSFSRPGHARRDSLCGKDRCAHVDTPDAIIIFLGDICERLRSVGAGIVDEDVEGGRRRDMPGKAGDIRYVGDQRLGLQSRRDQGGGFRL
jgi:hypothetical protein